VTIFLVILAILLVGGTTMLASERTVPLRWRMRGTVPRAARDQDAVPAPDGDVPPGPSGGPTATTPPGGDGLGLVEPVASLPPVLLPDEPSADDVDAVRFGLGLRGYRMDQVDEVLDRLAAALAERDAVIADLRQRQDRGPGA
jgi:DivIVA domain-containing protein